MKIGDKVTILHSPYLSVKNGTIATIKNIRFKQYGKHWEIYILDTTSCSIFRVYEIRKTDD